MAEDNNIVLATKEQGLGEVRIAPEVIEVIIGIAASQVEGCLLYTSDAADD